MTKNRQSCPFLGKVAENSVGIDEQSSWALLRGPGCGGKPGGPNPLRQAEKAPA